MDLINYVIMYFNWEDMFAEVGTKAQAEDLWTQISNYLL